MKTSLETLMEQLAESAGLQPEYVYFPEINSDPSTYHCSNQDRPEPSLLGNGIIVVHIPTGKRIL